MRISKIAAFDVSLALYKEPNRGLGHSVVRWANVYVKRAANKVLALTMSAAMSTDGHGPWGPTIWVGSQFFSPMLPHNLYELLTRQWLDGNTTARHLQLIF